MSRGTLWYTLQPRQRSERWGSDQRSSITPVPRYRACLNLPSLLHPQRTPTGFLTPGSPLLATGTQNPENYTIHLAVPEGHSGQAQLGASGSSMGVNGGLPPRTLTDPVSQLLPTALLPNNRLPGPHCLATNCSPFTNSNYSSDLGDPRALGRGWYVCLPHSYT